MKLHILVSHAIGPSLQSGGHVVPEIQCGPLKCAIVLVVREQWVVFALTCPPYQLAMTNHVTTLTRLVRPNAHRAHKTTVVLGWSMDT